MIKLVFCLKRLPGMTRDEFQDYWRNTHAPLVRSHAATLNISRYIQSHSMAEDPGFMLSRMRGSGGLDFDGVAELWWEDEESYAAPGLTPEGQAAGKALLDDEANFIDLPNSPIFLVRENHVVP